MPESKRVVLINPPSRVWGQETEHLLPILNTLPQIGIASLAAVLRREGLDVSILDAQALVKSPQQVVQWAVSQRPAIVGMTSYTSSVDSAALISGQIKKCLPDVVTVVGGPHVTAVPERTLLAFAQFDWGIVGEGETSAPSLFRAILEEGDPTAVPGASYRTGDLVHTNDRPPLIADLDGLPPPAYELFPGFPRSYRPPIFHSPHGRAITLMTSRGCPYRCTFCDRGLFGERYRFHSVPYIIEMIGRLRREYGASHFIFYDDNFTVNKKHLNELCEALLRLPFKITFSCDARADLVDDEMLRLMKRAGAWMISYGIETANEELLALLDKSLSLENAAEAVSLTRAAGIITKGLFMIGVPGETRQTIQRTRDFIRKVPFDLINLSKFTPYPGCEIYADIRKYGEFVEVWEQMSGMNFVFWPNTVEKEVLIEENNAILLDFYRNPRRWRGMIHLLKSGSDLSRLLSVLSFKLRRVLTGLFRPGKVKRLDI
jgi:radical SAM superfamily enzyme YgiQ (UPF0313 family)